MSKLANEIFDILKLCWSFSVAEKQYLKWVIITRGLKKFSPLFYPHSRGTFCPDTKVMATPQLKTTYSATEVAALEETILKPKFP